jgi:hypothetical protein
MRHSEVAQGRNEAEEHLETALVKRSDAEYAFGQYSKSKEL